MGTRAHWLAQSPGLRGGPAPLTGAPSGARPGVRLTGKRLPQRWAPAGLRAQGQGQAAGLRGPFPRPPRLAHSLLPSAVCAQCGPAQRQAFKGQCGRGRTGQGRGEPAHPVPAGRAGQRCVGSEPQLHARAGDSSCLDRGRARLQAPQPRPRWEEVEDGRRSPRGPTPGRWGSGPTGAAFWHVVQGLSCLRLCLFSLRGRRG